MNFLLKYKQSDHSGTAEISQVFAQQSNKKKKREITIMNSLLCFSSDLQVALPSSFLLFPLSGLISPRFCFLHCPSIFLLLSFNQTPLSFLISSTQDASSYPVMLFASRFLFFKKRSPSMSCFQCQNLFLPSLPFSEKHATVATMISELLMTFYWNKAENNGQQAAISFPRTNLISGFHS